MAHWVKIMTWQVFLLQEHRNELELIQENAFYSPPKSVDREYSLRSLPSLYFYFFPELVMHVTQCLQASTEPAGQL